MKKDDDKQPQPSDKPAPPTREDLEERAEVMRRRGIPFM
jgi:hypothetical protein